MKRDGGTDVRPFDVFEMMKKNRVFILRSSGFNFDFQQGSGKNFEVHNSLSSFHFQRKRKFGKYWPKEKIENGVSALVLPAASAGLLLKSLSRTIGKILMFGGGVSRDSVIVIPMEVVPWW